MDWMHCNNCYQMAAAAKNQFWFTSCGHVLCANCLRTGKVDPKNSSVSCLFCTKSAQIIEISRHSRPEILALFRQITDLVESQSNELKRVIEFQATQRLQLTKQFNEKDQKAINYAQSVKIEHEKWIAKERAAEIERNQAKEELDKSLAKERELEMILAEKEREIQKLISQQQRTSPGPSKKTPHRPSLNGNTPIVDVSFVDCATSTPYVEFANMLFGGEQTVGTVPTNANLQNFLNTPIMEESVVAGRRNLPNTPALFGYGRSPLRFHGTPNYF